jgi:hypothetical protein
MSDFDPDRIRQRLVEVGEEWCDKEAAASLLEETKKTVLAELKLKAEGTSDAAKETQALADPVYKLHVTNMILARKEANKAKVRWDSAKTWSELRRSKESTMREEMRMR